MKRNKSLQIYSDSSFSTSQKIKQILFDQIYSDTIGGKICYKIGDKKPVIKKVVISSIPDLKQYNNLFELFAAYVAIKEAAKISDDIILFTDSRTAASWISRCHNNLDKFSHKHSEIKHRIDELIQTLKKFTVKWVPRDNNLAGVYLEHGIY